MGLFEDAKKGLRAKREATKAQIRGALHGTSPRTADLMFDLSRGEKGTKLDSTRRAHVKAIELVSSLLGSFALPVRPKLQYQGMVRDSVDQHGVIEDGVIKVGVTLGTLMGHRAHIDVPVIVRNKQLVEPAVFFYDNAPYVMCGPALDDLVKRGSLQKETSIRPMFSPPLEGVPSQGEGAREPITNHEHMFSPGARNPYNFRRQYEKTAENHASKDNTDDPKFNAWIAMDKKAGEPRKRTNIDVPAERPELWDHDVQDEILDPAERCRDKLFGIGADVVLIEDIQARERGGGHLIVPSGERGKVLKDSCGEGKMLQVNFPAMCLSTMVPKRFLRSGAKLIKAAQMNNPQFVDETYLVNVGGEFMIGASGSLEVPDPYEEGETNYLDGMAYMYMDGGWHPWSKDAGSEAVAQKLNEEGWSAFLKTDALPVDDVEYVSWSKRAATVEQVQNEVKAMLREGYQDVDIKEAISRRYPEHAAEALVTLK